MKHFLPLFLLLAGFLLLIPVRTWAQNDHYPQYIEMGNQALAAEKFDLAIDYFTSAIEDKDDCWQAYVGLGTCYYYKKKYKDALVNYEKALKINPQNQDLTRFVQNLRLKLGIRPTPTRAPTPTPLPYNAPLPGLPPLPMPMGTPGVLPPPR